MSENIIVYKTISPDDYLSFQEVTYDTVLIYTEAEENENMEKTFGYNYNRITKCDVRRGFNVDRDFDLGVFE